MECVEGHNPVFLDLVKSEVDHLPDAGSHADLDQAGLLLQVLFCHELHLVLELLFFFLRLLVAVLKIYCIGLRLTGVTLNIVEVPAKPINTWKPLITESFASKPKYVKMDGFFGHQCKTVSNCTLKVHVTR